MLAQATIDTRLRPFEAVRAVRRLMANPEDTSQVFTIFRALRGKSGIKAFRRFAASPTGIEVLREKRQLLATLSDRTRLAAMPERRGFSAASRPGQTRGWPAERLLPRQSERLPGRWRARPN